MATEIIRADAFEKGPCEKIKCPSCGKEMELWSNGGEGDERKCCGVTYEARSIGYEIVAHKADAA